jgi:hypothetical protein
LDIKDLSTPLTLVILVFQAFIAYRQSKISETQKEIAQREFVSTHRPKIMVRNVYFDTSYEIGAPFGIRFNYINTGETDAEIECIEAHIFRSRRDDVSFENRSLIKCDYDRKSLSSGESGLATITRPDDFDGHETTDDRDLVFFVGCVKYRDSSAVHRQTGFARVYDGATRRFCRSDDEEYEYAY